MRGFLSSKWTKRLVYFLCFIPFLLLLFEAITDNLGINPVETLQHTTGDWTLRFLILTLCITPLRKACHLPELVRFRRTLGLSAFFYVSLHFLSYLGPDQGFRLGGMVEDVAKRPYITVGFAAFVLLVPLALTSTAAWIRRLGGRRWSQLHRLVYLVTILGVIHYDWLVKSNKTRPFTYAAVLFVLLLWRIVDSWKRATGGAPVAEA